MQMKKFRKNKGITLIALVVTIIVLLILAGISINMVTGQNGILKRAGEAKRRTGEAQERENIQVAITSAQTEDFAKESEITDETLRKEIKNTMGSDSNLSGTGPWWYNGEKNDYIINKKGKILEKGTLTYMYERALIDNCENEDGTCTNPEHLHVGDYVTYNEKVIKDKEPVTIEAERTMRCVKEEEKFSQTYSVDETTTWRVLGLNEDETEVQIISGSPIKRDGEEPYFHMDGAESYCYGEENLDRICKLYHNDEYASETRSMRTEDITRALGITIDKENNKAYKTTADGNRIEITSYYGDFGKTYTYKSGDHAPENWLNEKGDTTQKRKKVGDTVEGSLYSIPITEESVVKQGSVLYNMLFKATTESENWAKSYWLASPGVHVTTSGVSFGIGEVIDGDVSAGRGNFADFGGSLEKNAAIRPLVSLKSDITVEQIKVTTGSEPDWETKISNSIFRRDAGGIVDEP